MLAAIAGARAIVIGPSNPLASIAPILAVPGVREALIAADAPVVAVSPIVGGEVLKGPTASFMAFAALELSADGVADFYGELLDGIVADENVGRLVDASDGHAHGRRRKPRPRGRRDARLRRGPRGLAASSPSGRWAAGRGSRMKGQRPLSSAITCAPPRSCPSSASPWPSGRLGASVAETLRAELARAMVGDVLMALG